MSLPPIDEYVHHAHDTLPEALQWFLSLNPVEHLEGCYGNIACYGRVFRLDCDGKLQDERTGKSEIEVVVGPSTIETLYLDLLPTESAPIGLEIKTRFSDFAERLNQFRIECHDAVEQWLWDHNSCSLPDRLVEVIGQPMIERNEALRDEARQILRLCELVGRATNEGPTGYTDELMEQRDRWIYENRKAGMNNPQLISQLGKIFSARNWDHITTDEGIRKALKRYIARTGAVDFWFGK